MAEITIKRLFQTQRDLDFWKRINREYYRKIFFPINVYLYDRELKDEVYGEATDQSFNQATTNPSYQIEGYIENYPDYQEVLTQHGFDEARPIDLVFFLFDFEEMGLQAPRVGDHVFIDTLRYKVLDTNPRDYYINSGVPITMALRLETTRAEIFDQLPRRDGNDLYPVDQFTSAANESTGVEDCPASDTFSIDSDNPFES